MDDTALKGTAMTGPDRLVAVGILRWVLPLALATIAIVYESAEHLLIARQWRLPDFTFEVLVFGLLGPAGVFAALAYVRNTLLARVRAEAQLARLNQDLEKQVVERTVRLENALGELSRQALELESANTELRRLDELKSDFVALVSHELRAPLTTLSGGIELIAQDVDKLPADARRSLEIMATESLHLRKLVESILDVTRLQAGHLELSVDAVMLEPLIRRCVASTTIDGDSDHPPLVQVQRPLPPAWADEVYLEEVLHNLLRNAVRHSPPHHPVVVEARPQGDTLTVTVSNHGPTIPPEEQRRIFEAFYRGTSHSTGVRGYGLGLYFASKLMEAQGGSVSVRSPAFDDPEFPGAAFTVVIPRARDEA